MIFSILLFAEAATAAATVDGPKQPEYVDPPGFAECIAAVRRYDSASKELCETKDIKISLWGGPSYRQQCIYAMKRGERAVEAREKLGGPIADSFWKMFEEAYDECVNPPPPPPPTPVRETVHIWD